MSIVREPTQLWKRGLAAIPSPQKAVKREGEFALTGGTFVALAEGTDAEDEFAAQMLIAQIDERASFRMPLRRETTTPGAPSTGSERRSGAIRILREKLPPKSAAEGYELDVTPKGVTLRAETAAGIYYGVQTLIQIVQGLQAPFAIPAMHVEDWPDYRWRTIHYDTKHHQSTYDYVCDFIRKMASYKVNMILWEWEDKFGYTRHPEIAAPGAFTRREMQEFTALALKHHVQLVPLVQGLGHVSYILKHKKHWPLREIPASNWEFCPLKDGAYDLLFDLWDEAMDATPGVEFLHIGTDETYELGQGEACGCKTLAEEHGKEYLMQKFIHRCHEHIAKRGRKMISWGGGLVLGCPHRPPKDAISYDYSQKDRATAMLAVKQGYTKWVFVPNPLNCPLVVPMWPFETLGRKRRGSAAESADALDEGATLGGFEGATACSWDDPGRHNEMWNIRHVCAAEYMWTAHAPSIDEFLAKFFVGYFGPEQANLAELYRSMEARMFFYDSVLQRRIWHYGPVGKMSLVDLPRQDLEFDPFWRQRYGEDIERAKQELLALDRCADVIHDNLRRPLRNLDNLEIMLTMVELCRHNARFFTEMWEVEENIGRASNLHWLDRPKALDHLNKAADIVAAFVADRKDVMKSLIKVWERTRLPRGMSKGGKKYVHARDRARHFANRTADMSYHVHDEERLDMEGWLRDLRKIIAKYEEEGLGGGMFTP